MADLPRPSASIATARAPVEVEFKAEADSAAEISNIAEEINAVAVEEEGAEACRPAETEISNNRAEISCPDVLRRRRTKKR